MCKQSRILNIQNNVNKHKKALAFIFFNGDCELEITDIRIEELCNWSERSVVCFQKENKVIYEDEQSDLEQGMKKYLSWINHTALKDKKLYCKKVLDYPKCSFLEYLPQKGEMTIQEESDYYYRLGSLFALVASIGGRVSLSSDIVCKGASPVISDMKSILQNEAIFCETMRTYAESEKEYKRYCKDKFYNQMEEGYQVVYKFIKNNIDDVKMAIDWCFQVYNERRRKC